VPTSHFLITGSVAFDILLQFEGSFPEAFAPEKLGNLSVSFFAPRMKKTYGGTAANVAWNLRLLRQSVTLRGAVGEDGKEYRDRLEKAGIDCSLFSVVNGSDTATAIVATDSAERQIAFFHPGAGAKCDHRNILPGTKYSAVLITPESPDTMVATALDCRRNRLPYFFDPSQQSVSLSGDDLTRCTQGSAGLICNDYEWGIVSSKTSRNEEEVLEHTELLVITRGEKGALLHTKEGTVNVPACHPSRVINPTGAGDAFRAGLLTGLAHGFPLKTAGQLGCALASFVVEIEETQLEHFELQKLKERYKNTYREDIPTLEA
jgi:adenosine kinase